MPIKFIMKYNVLFTIRRVKIAKVSREVSQTVLEKRTQATADTAVLALTTTAQREELGPQKLLLLFQGTGFSFRPALSCLLLDKDTGPKLPLSFH